MWSASLLVLVPALLNLASAQTLLVYGNGALPTCAESCTLLQTAQNGCTPPAAPVSNQATYQSCFCQYTLIADLYTNPGAVCGTACTSAADLKVIQNWYSTLCGHSVVANAATASATTATGRTTTATARTTGARTTTSAAAAATSTAASSSSSSTANATNRNASWWSGHYQWVIMVIVLIIGFAALIYAGLWFKRRYNRKHNLASDMAEPVVWGPHQNQEYTGGISYPAAAIVGEKGRSKTTVTQHYDQGGAGPSEPEKTGRLQRMMNRS